MGRGQRKDIRGQRSAARHIVGLDRVSLLLHFDLAHHPEVLMRAFLIGRLAVGGERHLAVQKIMPGRKISPEPDDAADVMIIKDAA